MYARERIRQLTCEGATVTQVADTLKKEGIAACRQTVWRLQQHITKYGVIEPLPKSQRPNKLTITALPSIENLMECDNETTGKELVTAL